MLALHLKMSHGKTLFPKLVRDTRGKFIQDKLINRYYYAPFRLHEIGLIKYVSCWKCRTERWTYVDALWKLAKVFHFQTDDLECMGQ